MPHIVYVIELDESVMGDERWVNRNKNQRTREYYYVGQTSHSAECRFEQHRTPNGTDFHCICDKKPGEPVRPYSIGRAKFASDTGIALRLRPDMCDHLGGFDSSKDAKKAEQTLAKALRTEGHGAYADKLKKKKKKKKKKKNSALESGGTSASNL